MPTQAGLIDFTAERQRHIRFVGRDDVLAQLDEWLDTPGETGWVVVTGGPGMGKSAILSAWLARREAAGALVPHHFVRRQVADWDQPEVIAASLAAQIEAVFPALCDPDAKPERRLLELLGRVWKQQGPSGRLVVVVDGLDETRAEPGENPLPRFLPHILPPGIRFLCATRPTYPHLSWLDARSPVRRLDLDDRRWAASNGAVIRGFWKAVAREYRPRLPAATTAAAIERAEGNVLYAVMLHDALRSLPAAQRRADRVPRGLKGLFGEIWDRAASHAEVRAGLGILCAAQDGLSLDVLQELTGWSYEDREHFIRDARQLLLEEPASWAGIEAYRPRHDWVRELVNERLGAAMVRAHHATLARQLATWPAPADATARRYALRYALIHRTEAGNPADAWQIASDTSFLEAKVRELGVHEVEADLARAAELCRASQDDVLGLRFDDVLWALARESHWLRTTPEATAALVWNRLRRSGWSARDLDEYLQISAEAATFLRVRYTAMRESPTLVRDLVGHAGRVTACVVTPDGRRLVSASSDKTLKVWDLESGRTLSTLEGHAGWVMSCTLTPDGRRVISGSKDGTLKVWDLESGRTLSTLEVEGGEVTACVVMPDGRSVVSVSASRSGSLKVWDLVSRRALATLGCEDDVIACIAMLDGRRVVSGLSDGALKVWDLKNRCVLTTLRACGSGVTACAVTPDGQRVVSGSKDGTLRVWDLESGRTLSTLQVHGSEVTACVVMPDRRRVVSASYDGTLKIWDLENAHVLATLEGHSRGVIACTVTPDGRRVVSASRDRRLKVWDLESERSLTTLQGHTAVVTGFAIPPDGRRVISASLDGTLKVWDVESGRAIATLEGHTEGVLTSAVMPDGRRVVSASQEDTLKTWDLENGRALVTRKGLSPGVKVCAVTSDGRLGVLRSREGRLRVWELGSGRKFPTLEGHTDCVLGCTVTPDGRRVVSTSADQTLKIWDLESGHALATLKGHTDRVYMCAVTPDGRRVVSVSADQTLRVWELESGRALATLEGHAGWVRACAVTTDGRRVVSASADQTLKVWDLETNRCLFTHCGEVSYTAVAATATTIVAGEYTGGVWFLDWPPLMSR